MTAPAPLPRELSITYGGVTVGGPSTVYLLDSYYRAVRSWNHAFVEFDVVVKASSEPDFASRCAVLEANFADPDHSLVVQQGAQTLLAYAAAPKDYCRPTIQKKASPETDSGRTRGYTVRIDVDPAATQLSPEGLREVSVDVAYSPARRRTVTVAGLWTAVDGDGSRSAYEAGIESYASSALSDLGGTYELAEEPVTSRDRPDHLISFRRVYLERLWEEGGSGLDDDEIVRQTAIFRRHRTAPGDSNAVAGAGAGGGGGTNAPVTSKARRLTTVTVSYSAWIDKAVTDLKGKWETIRDWLLGVVQTDFSLGGFALVDEDASLDYDDRRINATLTVVGPEGGNLLERTISVSTDDNDDQILIPAWTGKRFSRYPYNAPTDLVRTVTLSSRLIGTPDEGDIRTEIKGWFRTGTEGVRGTETQGEWTRGRLVIGPLVRRTIGMEGHELQEVTEVQATLTRRYFEKVENGRGSASTGSGGGDRGRPATTP